MSDSNFSQKQWDEVQLKLQTATVEFKYQEALAQSKRLESEEDTRLLRLRITLLEQENDDLSNQISENWAVLEDAEDSEDRLRERLDEAEIQRSGLQNSLLLAHKERQALQAELASLNSISSNATKILTEKLALERELASLRPEIEHLRSQTSINNTVLSEKLALQRQVSQLEVELETERRASERAGRKDTAHAEAEESATSQLDELRKELAKEKRDAQKRQNEFHRKQGESESTVASYESKIESLRANLRSTKEQLRRLKEENQSLASKVAAQKLPQPASRPGGPNARKRDIARFDPDATIGTPGAVTDAKRIKRLSTLPGDKSTFSITPFLNRTTGKDAGDSDSEVADTSVCERAAVLPRSSTGNHNDKVIPEQSNLEMDKTLAGNVLVLASEDQSEKISVSSNSANGRPKVVRKHKLKDQSSLPQIQEDKDEAESAIEKPSNAQSDMSLPVKVKRKKLGGGSKTLFDEDDVDEAPARKKAMPFVSRGINLRPGGSAGLNKNVGLLKGSSFGSFSPLKRDRKIAQ